MHVIPLNCLCFIPCSSKYNRTKIIHDVRFQRGTGDPEELKRFTEAGMAYAEIDFMDAGQLSQQPMHAMILKREIMLFQKKLMEMRGRDGDNYLILSGGRMIGMIRCLNSGSPRNRLYSAKYSLKLQPHES